MILPTCARPPTTSRTSDGTPARAAWCGSSDSDFGGTRMNTLAVFSSTMLVITVLAAGCGRQPSALANAEAANVEAAADARATADAEAAASAPGVRYEAHVNAGGVPPAALPPPQPPPANASDAKAGEGLF